MRLFVFIGCIAVPFGSFGALPSGQTLWKRLDGGCAIPEIFRDLVEREKAFAEEGKELPPEKRQTFRLTSLKKGIEEVAESEVHVIVQTDKWVFGLKSGENFEAECAGDGNANLDGTVCMDSDWRNEARNDLFGDEEIREKETRRCFDVFESVEFWKAVFGPEWVEGIIEELRREDGCPYVRLGTSVRSFSCDAFPRSETSGFFKIRKPLPKASEKLVFYLEFELGHLDRVDRSTGKHIRLSNEFRQFILSDDAEYVADLKVKLRLIINMVTEKIEEIYVTDKFIVEGKTVSRFEETGFFGL